MITIMTPLRNKWLWVAAVAILLPVGVTCWIVFSGDSTSTAGRGTAAGVANAPAIFREITRDAGIQFVHQTGKPGSYFFPEIMAPGAALFDYDNDGDLDIYLIQSGPPPVEDGREAAGRNVNRLYRQDAGGVFTDTTEGSGLDDTGYGMGVAIGDINNDGYPDVYVTNFGPDRLFLNLGDGTFGDVTQSAGIDNRQWGTSAAFVDYDRDGWLDLFVTNYVDYFPGQKCFAASGREDYCGPQMFAGTADKLYRNLSSQAATEHGGAADTARVRFEDVSLESGIARKTGPGLGVCCADFNGDGWPDIYVANDREANFLWVNGKDGSFRDEAILWGVAYDALGRGQASMGIAAGDLNGDDRWDLLLTHIAGESNALYLSDAGASYREESATTGIATASFPFTGFGTVFADLEHDGDLDLLVVNGRVKRAGAATKSDDTAPAGGSGADPFWQIYAEPNQILLNDGHMHFQPLASAADAMTQAVEISRGLAVGDIDGDGDLDALVTNVAGPARLYRNDSEKQGNWLLVRVVDPRWGGRDAIGSIVTVAASGKRHTAIAHAAFSYLSSNDPRVHFGLGAAETNESIEVQWPDGTRESFPGGPVNRLRVLTRGEGETR